MVDHAKLLGTRVAESRRRAGLTQERLAERARVSLKTVQGIEQGRSEPELATLRRIARAVGVGVADLVEEETVTNARTMRRLHEELTALPPEMIAIISPLVHELARSHDARRDPKRVRPRGRR